MFRLTTTALAGLVAAAFAQCAAAGTIWDEDTNGDLSGDTSAPTSLTVALGTNTVSGTSIGIPEGNPDRDIFSFTVPDGAALTQLLLTEFTATDLAFLGLEAGVGITDTESAANLLGWLHPSADFVGTDILDDLALGAGAIGFDTPLGPGTYTLWFQQGNEVLTDYTFDLILAPVAVPEPSLAGWFAFGLIALGVTRRRRA